MIISNMKINILIVIAVIFFTFASQAQYQYIDLLTLHTNIVTTAGVGNLITISNVCTNMPDIVTNPAYITMGDSVPTAFSKINSDFNYVSNLYSQSLNLPLIQIICIIYQ